jgi:PAS domain S-box-containing protein
MTPSSKKSLRITFVSMVLLCAIARITIDGSSRTKETRDIGKGTASMFLVSHRTGSADTDEAYREDPLDPADWGNCANNGSEWFGFPAAVESALIAGGTSHGGILIWLMIAAIGAALGVFMSAFERFSVDPAVQADHALGDSQQLREQIRSQQEELGKANRALALYYAVTQALGDSATLADAASLVLHTICVMTDSNVGTIWDVDIQTGKRRRVAVWPSKDNVAQGPVQEAPISSHTAGGLVRAIHSRRPQWIAQIEDFNREGEVKQHSKEVARSGFIMPIIFGNDPIGALELYSFDRRKRDKDLVELLSTISSHIGHLIQRNRIDLALRESESRFRTLTEAASDAIITIDETSTIVLINPAAEQVFGYTAAEMIGQDLTMLMPEYFRRLHRAGVARHLETGHRHTNWKAIELPGLHKSGREIPLEISFGKFTRGSQHFFTGIARDITERKRAEEALRKSEEERMLELDRIRQRIAADLHDDIGSSLTKICLLSESARQRTSSETGGPHQSLAAINNLSNELVESMSDIVWAINPHKDHLSDLSQRMRRFASDIFTACQIAFSFDGPGPEKNIRVGANVRREAFLIFKESINNIVKHADCKEVALNLSVDSGWLRLVVSDDGEGFDPSLVKASTGYLTSQRRGGNGLASMRRRTKELGGHLDITTSKGFGTRVSLSVPISFGLQG